MTKYLAVTVGIAGLALLVAGAAIDVERADTGPAAVMQLAGEPPAAEPEQPAEVAKQNPAEAGRDFASKSESIAVAVAK